MKVTRLPISAPLTLRELENGQTFVFRDVPGGAIFMKCSSAVNWKAREGEIPIVNLLSGVIQVGTAEVPVLCVPLEAKEVR